MTDIEKLVAEVCDATMRLDARAAERALRRFRTGRGLAVHHINGDPNDNSPENTRLVPWRENRRNV